MCNNSVRNSSYCGPHPLKDVTSLNQFARDYNNVIKLYAGDCDYPKEIHKVPPLELLLKFAEQEFQKKFFKVPTYAAYAPASVNLCGELTDSNDGKVLSMAVQLVTVIVGTRRIKSRRCKVKTLSRELDEANYGEFCINTRDLDTSSGPRWLSYIKSVVQNFSIPQAKIPGFKALVLSSIPIKSGLASGSALRVATYTFLEAITNVNTYNILEKAIACQQVEQMSMTVPCSLSETLVSVAGIEGKVLEFDSRILQIKEYNWNTLDVDLILINSNQETIDSLLYQKYMDQCRPITFALNITSLRDTTVSQLSTIEHLFPSTLLQRAHHIISETNRVTQAVQEIKEHRWQNLGRLMWESHCSMRDKFGSSSVKIEYIMGAIQNIKGVYGAKIIGRGYGGMVLAMVHRQAIKIILNALSHVAECQDYRVIRPSSGAAILYTDVNDQCSRIISSTRYAKKSVRYHLPFGNYENYENYEKHRDAVYGSKHEKAFEPLKAVSIKDT